MLAEVTVKNFALLEDLRLELGPGLVVLTGETGAGKSLLLEALGLVLGRRAEEGQLRRGADRWVVSARFEKLGGRVRERLNELGLAEGDGEELLLRREVDVAGKSKAFVNDRPVNLATLNRLGELLVYAHGQGEQQLLLRPTEQRRLLDSFGGLESLAQDVAVAHGVWRERLAERDAGVISEQERSQKLDLYRFQKKELDAAAVRPEEDAELELLLPQLKNADRLKSGAEGAYALLYGQENSATDLVRKVQHEVEVLRAAGAPLAEVGELLEVAAVQLEEASHRIDSFGAGVDVDPARLESVLVRLDLLSRLKKKYGPTLAEVAVFHGRVTQELERLENREMETRLLADRLAQAEAAFFEKATRLSQQRRRAAKKMSAAVQRELKDVGLADATFRVEVVAEADRSSSSGIDRVEFLFEANPGEGQTRLSETASGGELSRVMLALESVFVRGDEVPVLIFDEIDAGVGGAIGGVLGKKLATLGRGRQVLCVTHLATIAACADAHCVVEKEVRGDRTRAVLRLLTDPERPAEIARLFGSAPGADAAIGLRHARELLSLSRSR